MSGRDLRAGAGLTEERRSGLSVLVVSLMLVVVAGGLAACTGSSSPPPPTSAVSTDPAGAVLAAYRSMWADLVTAARTSDFQSPLLAQHASGDVLTLFVQGLARDQLHGIVTRGTPILHPRVTSLAPGGDPITATVEDCFDDSHWLEYTTKRGLAENTPGGRRHTTAHLAKVAGIWKVTGLTIEATGTC